MGSGSQTPVEGAEDRRRARRQYDNAWYASKPEGWKRARQDQKNVRRRAIRKVINDHKVGKSCGCGESHPACLDFHHEGGKEINVSDAVRLGWAVEKVVAEIAKCVIICSNCHRKLHYTGV